MIKNVKVLWIHAFWWKIITNFIGPFIPMMVEGQPPRSSVRRSSPSPEKLPNEKVLRVGETSRWSSCIRKGTPIRRCRFFPVWWNGIEPFLSRSSLRFFNWKSSDRIKLSRVWLYQGSARRMSSQNESLLLIKGNKQEHSRNNHLAQTLTLWNKEQNELRDYKHTHRLLT